MSPTLFKPRAIHWTYFECTEAFIFSRLVNFQKFRLDIAHFCTPYPLCSKGVFLHLMVGVLESSVVTTPCDGQCRSLRRWPSDGRSRSLRWWPHRVMVGAGVFRGDYVMAWAGVFGGDQLMVGAGVFTGDHSMWWPDGAGVFGGDHLMVGAGVLGARAGVFGGD